MKFDIEWELKKAKEYLEKGLTEAILAKDYDLAKDIIDLIAELKDLLDD